MMFSPSNEKVTLTILSIFFELLWMGSFPNYILTINYRHVEKAPDFSEFFCFTESVSEF